MIHPLFRRSRWTSTLLWIASLGVVSVSTPALAEPYLAIRTGQRCMVCHTNPTGGGKRTNFGNLYGQTTLSAKTAGDLLVSDIADHLKVGMDFRGAASTTIIEDDDNEIAFSTERASLYLEADVIPDRLSLYVDERLAPGASNREAWIQYKSAAKKAFVLAGSFFLPYGLRLEDDSAFIRQATGVSFNNADSGVMIGHDRGPWSTRLSLTNGTNGGAETNRGKQLSARAAFIKPTWRLGASANTNPGANGVSRTMWNLFGGLRLLGIDWLAEVDWIRDEEADSSSIRQTLGLIEANKEILKGHNLKGTYEWLDPDTDVADNIRSRTSIVYEYSPIPMLQIRTGARIQVGIPQNSAQNTDTVFAQVHLWYH